MTTQHHGSGEQVQAERTGAWTFLRETRVGSVSLLGCIVQPLLVGLIMAVIVGVLMAVLR